ncbi:AbiH family protein, partial [Enterococcus faecalis]|uniref:AbiH family protein n=1 Tax=Enterococcus faecalis TaxID=1351 RepID=UPI0030C87B6C
QCKMYLGHVKVLLGMFLSLKTLYRKRTVIWPFYFYTIIRTLSNSFNTLNSKISIVNVHGTVKNDNIIFGIDQEKINPNKPIFRFTKTFRQMTETKLASTYEQEILLPKNEVYEIAFFGHSLSELDYSYFQTIFDHYDLYASNISLTFYYKVYEGMTQEAMELDLADKISKLLHNYSDSIDNSKKGKNLLHKLLLEKRLIIKEII